MMQFEIQRDGITGALAFKGTISLLDLVNLRLDRMDLALLADPLTLDRLCEDFRDEVFRKAGKEQPPQAG